MKIAITRAVSPAIEYCELTYLERQPINLDLAQQQHRQYEAALAALGCQVISLPVLADQPDSVFVEDTAIVLDELAIITRPGAQSRRPEIESMAATLADHRTLHHINGGGTIEGGDVLRIGKTIYVGISSRTNLAGIEQLRAIAEAAGYTVRPVTVSGCLHLKTAVTQVGTDTLLGNRAWVDMDALKNGFDFIDVDPAEPMAGNAVLIGSTIIYPTDFPRTRERLEERGIPVSAVDASEIGKAEGGVTCCSLIFNQS